MIAVVFALKFEGAAFRNASYPGLEVWEIQLTGAAAAARLARKMDATMPEAVISAGFGGGLQAGLAVGDLIIGENYSDPEILACLPADRWRQGKVHTATTVVETTDEKRRLGAETGALVVDMETAHLAQVCQERGVPMLSVRCVSDSVDDAMPVPANYLLDPASGRPQLLRLFGYLATHPSSIRGFSHLIKNAGLAQAQLANGLREILPALLQSPEGGGE